MYYHRPNSSSCNRHNPTLTPSRQSQRQQLFKIRHPKPSHRIPTLRRIPARKRDDTSPGNRRSSLAIDTVAAYRAATGDVGEAKEANGVEPRVEEAEGLLADAEAGVVEEGDDG